MITTNLKTAARRWFDLPTPAAAAICVFILVLIAGVVGHLRRDTPSAAAVPTPALAIIIATSVPQPIPLPTAAAVVAAEKAGNVIRKAIVVYGAADGTTAIGAVEPGRSYQVLAKYGADWLQVDISGGTGVVFVRTADLFDIPADLVDLAPPPQPVVVDRPIYVSAPAAAPEQAAPTASEPSAPSATLAPQQLVILDRGQWAMDAQQAGR